MSRRTTRYTSWRLVASIIIGILMTCIATFLGLAEFSLLLLWDIAMITYIVWVWLIVWKMSPEDTKIHAVQEDPGRTVTDILLLCASVVSLVAVIFLIMQADRATGTAKVLDIIMGITSIVISWILVHTIYTLKYARLYYSKPIGGINFNESCPPKYIDFGYLAFTVGMAFQVSDTALSAEKIRLTLLRHALLSFVFNTIIIASTVNIMANLF